ncbi:TetR/AcrR family transcriptional regulator [Mycolicibacterium sp.]|uniref:TetR/AcrR family transcriptional regulator n=1 Tax=Mycolicibacterium sp. TaxID=2320850 RepID=UPI003D10029C
MAQAPARRLRADARRNRDAILRAAREAFASQGIYAPIDGIATAAGVGNATLYRNFPTRDDLLSAVIEDSVRELLGTADALDRDLEPEMALREWLYHLVWALRSWHDLPTCIATAYGDRDSPVQEVLIALTDRTGRFLDRVRRDGVGADGVSADDVFQLATALSWAVDRFGDDQQRARARVDLATAGLFRRRRRD